MTRPLRLSTRPGARLLTVLALFSLLVGGLCSSLSQPVAAKPKPKPGKTKEPPRPPLKPREAAADARVALSNLLGEYVLLAWNGTTAAAEGRLPEQRAAFGALDANAGELAHQVGRLYGDKNGDAFGQQWKRHLPLLLDYAVAARKKDTTKQEQVTKAMDAVATSLASVVTGMSGGKRTAEAVASSHRSFLAVMRQMIDGRAAGNYNGEFTAMAKAYRDAWEMGRELAVAGVALAPGKFPGRPDSPAANFRASLCCLLAENSYMQSVASLAALGGRTDEFYAIAVRLDLNSEELNKLLVNVLGEDNGGKFVSAWKKQQGFVADYSHARDLRDTTTRSKLITDLDKSALEMADVLVTISRRRLPARNMQNFCRQRVKDIEVIIDSWSGKKWGAGFGRLNESWKHSVGLANTLADAVVEEYSDKINPPEEKKEPVTEDK